MLCANAQHCFIVNVQGLRLWVEAADAGVVVVSFGIGIRTLPKDLVEKMAGAFARLPQKVVWRYVSLFSNLSCVPFVVVKPCHQQSVHYGSSKCDCLMWATPLSSWQQESKRVLLQHCNCLSGAWILDQW